MSDIQEKIELEGDIARLVSEKKSTLKNLESLKAEAGLISKYIKDHREILEGLCEEIKTVGNEISSKRLKVNTEVGQKEEELKRKFEEAEKIIEISKTFDEREKKLLAKEEVLKKREQDNVLKRNELTQIESDLRISIKKVESDASQLEKREKEFDSKRKSLREEFIAKVQTL